MSTEFCDDCRRKIELNPLRVFDCKVERCRELSRGLPLVGNYLCEACARNFTDVRRHLDVYGLRYRIEPRLVRGIDYYTRTTFEVVTSSAGQQNAVLGGGRYDNLMKTYGGPDIPATGFAMGMERMLEAAGLPTKPDQFVYVAFLGDEAKTRASWLTRIMRGKGIECLLEFKERSLKAQLGRAAKLGAAFAVIIGEDEVRNRRMIVKDLSAGTQVEEPIAWLEAEGLSTSILKRFLGATGRPPREDKDSP